MGLGSAERSPYLRETPGGGPDVHKRRTVMTTFDDRERAFENKYAHDEEMRFRAEARRDRLLGLWAAGLMGLGLGCMYPLIMTIVNDYGATM